MEALEQSLQLLDQACAIIQELVAQLQAKNQQGDMSKKAEEFAVKTGVSYDEASDIIKTASETGTSYDALLQATQVLRRNQPFGKVASEDSTTIAKTGSVAMDSFLEKEAALLEELGL